VPVDRTRLGVVLIVSSVFLLSFGDALVKLASADFSLWQLYVARSVFALPLLALLLPLEGRSLALWPRHPLWVLLRSALLVLMWIAYYAALAGMTMSAASVTLCTSPLFIALFSAALVGEAVTLRRWAGIVVGFLGVLVILRPGSEAFSLVALLPIGGAACYALAMVITRSKCAEERPLVLALSLNLGLLAVGTLGTLTIVLWPLDPDLASTQPFLLGGWTEMAARDWGLMGLLGVVTAVVSIGAAKAYQSGPAAIIGTFDYTYLVFAALWGFLIFGERPGGATFLGAILITAAGWLVIPRENSQAGRSTAASGNLR
jgi:drug/metabolite transporter (DMT)-like permease